MKKVMIFVSTERDYELLTLAAEQKEVSRSEFIRQSFRQAARRVLAGVTSVNEPAEAGG
jgi:uncharacterized protein (DUF1778 family)